MFKIALDYWNFIVPDIFSSSTTIDVNAAFAFGGPVAPSNRRSLYAGILSKLRTLMITRMAKPEEVRARGSRRAGIHPLWPEASALPSDVEIKDVEHGRGCRVPYAM